MMIEYSIFVYRFAANYGILRNVFDFDPHVLYAFIYLCADKEFPALCELIPPYLSLSWLAHCAKNVKRMKDQEVCNYPTCISNYTVDVR